MCVEGVVLYMGGGHGWPCARSERSVRGGATRETERSARRARGLHMEALLVRPEGQHTDRESCAWCASGFASSSGAHTSLKLIENQAEDDHSTMDGQKD